MYSSCLYKEFITVITYYICACTNIYTDDNTTIITHTVLSSLVICPIPNTNCHKNWSDDLYNCYAKSQSQLQLHKSLTISNQISCSDSSNKSSIKSMQLWICMYFTLAIIPLVQLEPVHPTKHSHLLKDTHMPL